MWLADSSAAVMTGRTRDQSPHATRCSAIARAAIARAGSMGGERGAYGNLTFHQFSFSDGHTSPATAAVPPSDSCRCPAERFVPLLTRDGNAWQFRQVRPPERRPPPRRRHNAGYVAREPVGETHEPVRVLKPIKKPPWRDAIWRPSSYDDA